MEACIKHILPQYPNAIRIQWVIEDPVDERVDNVTFTIERSGSPGGPWETRAAGLIGVSYRDEFSDSADDTEESNLLALSREVWYRVIATLDDGETLVSEPVDNFGTLPTVFSHVDGVGLTAKRKQNQPGPQNTPFSPNSLANQRLQLVQRSIQRRALINLQFFSGNFFAVLKKRHFGKRCSVCFDDLTKQTLISNCNSCYGTGWEGGYYDPILTTGKIQESPLQEQTERSSQTEIIQAGIELLDFPRLEKGDVLVELDKNRRWRVDSISDRILRRRRITQTARCRELDRSAVAYRVDIDRSSLEEMIYD